MPKKKGSITLPFDRDEIIKDYRFAYQSRQVSLIVRREVLSGKAKFGIFGDGKEVVNLALARAFRKGDWRAGYYRDQTWMFALGVEKITEYFAQLYADTDVNHDPISAGRLMGGHFGTRYLNDDGSWKNQMEMHNISIDVSPTAAQMPRSVGLAYASVLYRKIPELSQFKDFSRNGNEVTFVTIGNASTAEGMFWESVNAIGVLKAPAVVSVYDDGYGISVPNQFQMVKENIGSLLKGFERDVDAPPEQAERGYDHYTVHAWDYPALVETYLTAAEVAREYHIPSLVHVIDVTQPQGHSTSGSHERYKSPERLKWEEEFDCVTRMRAWMIEKQIATAAEITAFEKEDYEIVEGYRKSAWEAFITPIEEERKQVMDILDEIAPTSKHDSELRNVRERLSNVPMIARRDIHAAAHEALRVLRDEGHPSKQVLAQWKSENDKLNVERYGSLLHTGTAMKVNEIKPAYADDSPTVFGFEIMNAAFDSALAREPRLVAFGEDVGKLGDVNQGFKGMQEKYGALRVTDTGIREATIVGQAIGLAQRGFRPIAEIQYLDYLLYALQLLSDDLATLYWRSAGGQKAPVIVRTRGHRLEGVWHSGSPMAGILNLVRGMYVLVPRDMTRAAGFYNTMLKSDEPALIVEVLNGYRVKERLPKNLSEMTIPLGVPEILREGKDVTLVTYGACCRIAMDAAEKLSKAGIDIEVIDAQTLLPFDIHGKILESLKKTNRILFVDEDVPGGATAYMLQEVIEKQGGYFHLDSPAKTLPGKVHRPAYGSDGDYWSKPNAETIFDTVYEMMNEVDPSAYPLFK
jgi:pyruvate/2-oxoglutarate/acetoin dehydrogenase E1 component/TPP-dependent pyruvate/acetoin dehydrogenase alpha subunit